MQGALRNSALSCCFRAVGSQLPLTFLPRALWEQLEEDKRMGERAPLLLHPGVTSESADWVVRPGGKAQQEELRCSGWSWGSLRVPGLGVQCRPEKRTGQAALPAWAGGVPLPGLEGGPGFIRRHRWDGFRRDELPGPPGGEQALRHPWHRSGRAQGGACSLYFSTFSGAAQAWPGVTALVGYRSCETGGRGVPHLSKKRGLLGGEGRD